MLLIWCSSNFFSSCVIFSGGFSNQLEKQIKKLQKIVQAAMFFFFFSLCLSLPLSFWCVFLFFAAKFLFRVFCVFCAFKESNNMHNVKTTKKNGTKLLLKASVFRKPQTKKKTIILQDSRRESKIYRKKIPATEWNVKKGTTRRNFG